MLKFIVYVDYIVSFLFLSYFLLEDVIDPNVHCARVIWLDDDCIRARAYEHADAEGSMNLQNFNNE